MKFKVFTFLVLLSFSILVMINSRVKHRRSMAKNSTQAKNNKKPASPQSKKKVVPKRKPLTKKELEAQEKKDEKSATSTIGPEAVYGRIRNLIEEIALVSMAKSDLKVKKKVVGSLSESYPKELIEIAKKKHYDKETFKSVMALPNKIYKFCIFPSYDLNYSNWCEKKYSVQSQQKLVNCRNTFCSVCCDNLQIMFRNQADNNILGESLALAKEGGYKKIQNAATMQEIHECRKECQKNYPVAFPKPPLPVPRDPNLGKWAEYPAKSCADIKKWGAENNDSGTYWVDLGKKGKVQVYCDMYSLRGGWTLFFNYMKLPNGEVTIQEGKLPSDLKVNTHMDLRNAGFSENDVQELRFFCTEKSSEKYFWHFKTDSPTMLSAAFSGDQRKIDLEEFKNTYGELQFPGKVVMWKKAMDQFEMQDTLDYVGKSNNGSFWNRPFGSESAGKFWTVKGEDKNHHAFECGTKHKSALESATAYTHHTVWFRGDPPSESFARSRYYNKEIKKLKQETMRVEDAKKQEEAKKK